MVTEKSVTTTRLSKTFPKHNIVIVEKKMLVAFLELNIITKKESP